VRPSVSTPATPPAEPEEGLITPTGKPVETVQPSPSASIGAACLTKAERRGIVTFRSRPGATLTGAVLGSGPSGVVIVHRSRSDLCNSLPYGRHLATRGHHVLVFDLGGNGSSGYVRYDEAATPLAFDVAAAATALRTYGARRVVVIGVGGGAVATLTAATFATPAFNGVVGISSADRHFGLDARAAVKRLPDLPLLLVAAADDHTYDGETQNLYRLAVSRNKRLMIVPGDRYGEIMFEHGIADPSNPYAVRDAVDAFVARYAGPPA
jgi:alpha-beta hydrolase superfamily lysophospholipase